MIQWVDRTNLLLIRESQNGLGWEEPSRSSNANTLAVSRDASHWTRLLRVPSSWPWTVPGMGHLPVVLGFFSPSLFLSWYFLTSFYSLSTSMVVIVAVIIIIFQSRRISVGAFNTSWWNVPFQWKKSTPAINDYKITEVLGALYLLKQECPFISCVHGQVWGPS